MFYVDHHLHTTLHSPDSIIEPEELAYRARRAGLDALVVTDHDHQWTEAELEEVNNSSSGVLILSGVEVSAREGHFLVYGLPSHREAPPGIALADLLQVVNRYQAAIVAAHPFRWGQPFDEIVRTHGPVFHGVELVSNNVTAETRRLASELLERTPMPATGSSDAHVPDVIGCYRTAFESRIRSMPEFVAALRSGRFHACHCPGAGLMSGPVEPSSARSADAVVFGGATGTAFSEV
jgi:predicted metal-dependent phosphoesterase TrpH